MSGPYLAANGAHVVELDAWIPYYGAPVATVSLADGSALASPVTLSIGTLSLAMSIASYPDGTAATQTFAGVTTARLVGGANGWRRPVTMPPYRAPPGSAGVSMTLVLGNLAAMVGETVSVAADRVLGPFFATEPRAPASRILSILAGSLWWIDALGVTQVAPTRPTSTIGSQASVMHIDGGRGWATVATEDPASWVPGATYSSGAAPTLTVSAARIRAGADGVMRHEVLLS